MQLRRAIIGLAVALGVLSVPAIAQSPYPAGPPAPVPALPDSARLTTYTISATTCACAVNFQLYGDGTDYQNWVEVWLNGVPVAYNDATFGWTITSATGQLSTIPRPITNAVLTFNNAQTGTVQIVGARRPRRTAQFSENRGVAARDLNQAFTDIVATQRETWDRTNDITGRGLFFAPGNVVGQMPAASACQNAYLGFDGTGLVPLCGKPVPAGTLSTPGSTTSGALTIWTSTDGLHLGQTTALPNGTTATTQTSSDNTADVATDAFVQTAKTAAQAFATNIANGPINSQAASYSIQTSDCGSVVVETGAFQTVTLPAAAGFTAPCRITIVNGHASRAQVLSGFPSGVASTGCGNLCLYPTQSVTIALVSGAWKTVKAAGRYQVGSAVLNVAATACNDSNDGLSATAPLCHINTCISLFVSNFDGLGTNPTCQLADGSYTEAVSYAGFGPYAKDGIVINGNSITPTNVLISAPAGNPAFFCRDYCVLFIQYLEVSCTGLSSSCVSSSQFSTVDVKSVYMGGADGNSAFFAWSHGHIDFNTGNVVVGNAGNLFIATEGGEISVGNQLLSCIGTLNITFFANVSHLGHINASGLTFAGCGSVSGTRYNGGYNGTINTGGGGASFFPGTVAGSVATGAQYQ